MFQGFRNTFKNRTFKQALLFFGAFCTLFFFTQLFLSQSSLASKYNTETSSSTRALGMGGAGINLERGAHSVFYNPANLAAKNTGNSFQLLNIQLGVSEGAAAAGWGTSFSTLSMGLLYQSLTRRPNTFMGSRYSLYPNITLRFLSIGYLHEVDQGGFIHPGDGSLFVKARNRSGPVAALSFKLLNGIFRVGAAVQLLAVGNAKKWVPPANLPGQANYRAHIQSGMGLQKTAGATLTFPLRFLPSFSFVARDIGTTSYNANTIFGTAGLPDEQPMTFDAAVGLTIYLGKHFELRSELDYKDLTNVLGTGGYLEKSFFGTELNAFRMLNFRGGMMNGYWTGGVGIETPKGSLDFAIFTEEIGDAFRAAKDTRFVVHYRYNTFGKGKRK